MPCHDELHEGEHDAMIDRDRYHRLRAILDARGSAGRQRPRAPTYLQRGILRCAHCDAAMTLASTRKNGLAYRSYRCVTRDKEGRNACPARPLPADAVEGDRRVHERAPEMPTRSPNSQTSHLAQRIHHPRWRLCDRPADAVEGFVVDRIREATADGALAADVERQLRAPVESMRGRLVTERRGLPAQIAKLSAEGRRLVEKIGEATGAASGPPDPQIAEVDGELGRCETRLAEVERDFAALDQVEIEGRGVGQALANFDAVWDVLTIENRARLVRAPVRRVEVDETTGVATAILIDLGIDAIPEDLAPGAPPPRVSAPAALAEATA